MKKTTLALLSLMMFLWMGCAQSEETLKVTAPGSISPYQVVQVAVAAPGKGTVTIHVAGAYFSYRDIVTNAEVDGGETVFSYNGLSYNGQPLHQGDYTLTFVWNGEDGSEASTQSQLKVLSPLPAIEYALPLTDSLYIGQTDPWYIDLKLSAKGKIQCDFFSVDDLKTPVYTASVDANAPLKNYRIAWKGTGKKNAALPAGQYVIRSYAVENPNYVIENTVSLLEGALQTIPLTVTESWYPETYDDDAVVWAKLMEPVVVVDAAQMSRAKFYEKPNEASRLVGSIYGTTVAVNVLELNVGKFAKIGAYCSFDGEYREGYMLQKYLKFVYPNTRYGVVLDKNTQTMTVYENGKKLGVMKVSTGLMTGTDFAAETRAGVYLTFDRLTDFHQDGMRYDYPIRIDGPHLIHQMGYTYSSSVSANFSVQTPLLGQKASHGCVRMNSDITEESGGVNAYWCWTHFCVRTKFIIIDDTQARQARMAELKDALRNR